jgi:hypothetical protein
MQRSDRYYSRLRFLVFFLSFVCAFVLSRRLNRLLAHARDGCQGLVEFVESLQHLRQFWRILSCSLDGALIEQALVSVWSLAGAERQLCGSLRPMQPIARIRIDFRIAVLGRV